MPDEFGHHVRGGEEPSVVAAAAVQPPVGPPPLDRAPTGVPPEELARYRMTFGWLGQLGEIQLRLEPTTTDAGGKTLLRATGSGKGSVLGLGETERRFETEMDPSAPVPRRWIATRVVSGKTTVDSNDVPRPGKVVMLRQRAGHPDEAAVLRRPRPIIDPLTLLIRLRAKPPRAPVVFEILDGRALWLITVQPAERTHLDGPTSPLALRLRGHAEPLDWAGEHDPGRTAREFTLWLDDDPYHAPLRLTLSLPLGNLRVDRVALSRPEMASPARNGIARLFKWLPSAVQTAKASTSVGP